MYQAQIHELAHAFKLTHISMITQPQLYKYIQTNKQQTNTKTDKQRDRQSTNHNNRTKTQRQKESYNLSFNITIAQMVYIRRCLDPGRSIGCRHRFLLL